jgi:ATP-dependent Clp protease ATP-binding subunit ClpC
MVKVAEPSVDEAIEILRGLRSRYEEHHKVEITDGALDASARLADRYISDRFLPDKAIDLIDEAASRVRLRSAMAPEGLRASKHELAAVEKELNALPQRGDYSRSQFLDEQKSYLKDRIAEQQSAWDEDRANQPMVVGEDEVAQIVYAWTGIPVSRLVETETQKLLKMEDELHKRIISQHEAIVAVSKAVRRARSGLKDPKRPMGSFLFLGPTGVGKTELARALAAFLFEKEDNLIRIDMSEYMERFAVSRLVGAPPGYVGYDEGGQLTKAVRRKPYSVILLDEIEKAHPEVFNILLQVMEDGRLTDAQGRVVDFKNTVLIMTSNIGAHIINREQGIGFRSLKPKDEDQKAYEGMKNRIQEELKRVFRPEFINRVDETIVFHSLTAADINQIVDLMLGNVRKQVSQQGMDLVVTDPVRERLATEGYDPQFGARPLRRAVQRLIEDPLSEEVLLGRFSAGDTIRADLDGEGETATVIFRKVEAPDAGGAPDGQPEALSAPSGGMAELPPPPPALEG